MVDAAPESLNRLPRKGAPRCVADRDGDSHRHAEALLLEHRLGGVKGGLGIQGVENRLHKQQVHPAVYQAAHLLRVGLHKLLEARVAYLRAVHVGADRRGAVRRPDGTGHECLAAMRGAELVGGPSGDAGGLDVQLTA
jgi:hypothetical protein